MTRRNPKRDPRQRAGLTLATPRRVRLEVDATPWELLSRELRARAHRPLPRVSLAWSARVDATEVPVAYQSSPIAREQRTAILAALADAGLPAAALRAVDALCWAHVARVRYPDGQALAFGLSQAPRDVAHVEAEGYPIARLDGRRVRSWEGILHGHTDAEVLGAVEFVRSRTIAPDAAAGAGR